MNDNDSQSKLAHDLMKEDSLGTLGQEKKDFYCLVLKSTITQKQKSILNIPLFFDEIDLEYNQLFAQVTMYHLNIGQPMSEKQKRNWWSKNKKLAKYTLNEKQSNITCGLKKIFFGTYQDSLILTMPIFLNTFMTSV